MSPPEETHGQVHGEAEWTSQACHVAGRSASAAAACGACGGSGHHHRRRGASTFPSRMDARTLLLLRRRRRRMYSVYVVSFANRQETIFTSSDARAMSGSIYLQDHYLEGTCDSADVCATVSPSLVERTEASLSYKQKQPAGSSTVHACSYDSISSSNFNFSFVTSQQNLITAFDRASQILTLTASAS